jgi:glycosyltransferase involved in cell wall biosynthesis
MSVNRRSRHLVVMVATYNRLALLKTVLEAIAKGTRSEHEVIVIDGGSTDGTIEFLQSHPAITPVLQGKLLGTARCYNRVWREIDSDYSCWLSDDTEIVPGSLDTAIEVLKADPGIGMVGLKMKDTKGPGRHEPYRGGISEYGILNCNHGVLPTAVARAAGFFNEQYRAYFIDPDLTASVLALGKRVVMSKAVSVLHHREWAEKEGDEKVAREMGGIDNQAIYHERFRFLANTRTTAVRVRSRIGRYVTRLLFLGAPPESKRLGLNRRDWQNLSAGRFISVLDPLRTAGQPYHLVQRIKPAVLARAANPLTTAERGTAA